MDEPIGFDLLTYQNSRDDLLKYREKGALRGVYLGYGNLHERYTMSLPGCTDWTGAPQSGKTEFLLDLLLNTSLFYGWKHLLYVPDVGAKNEILSILIHKLTGKTFDKRYVNSNYITEEEVDRNLQWVISHFFILVKKDSRTKITPYQFWDYAIKLKKDIGIQTATIDSWKDMKRYVGRDGESISRDDLYLEDVLEYRNSLSEEHSIHFHIVIHPLKTEFDKNNKRLPAGPYDLKGGPTWFDMGKCMNTVHRVDGFPNKVHIMTQKAKPDSVASLGTTEMYFDRKLRRYYWENNGEKIYHSKNIINPIGLELFEGDENEDLPF